MIGIDRFQEARKIVNKEMDSLLQEGFDLGGEIECLRSGRLLKRKPKKTCMLAVPPPRVMVWAGVQVGVPEMSTIVVMTVVMNVQVVRYIMYGSVVSQTSGKVAPVTGVVDVEMGGMLGSPLRLAAIPVGPLVPIAPVPVVVRSQALSIHGVDCRRGKRALLAAPKGFK